MRTTCCGDRHLMYGGTLFGGLCHRGLYSRVSVQGISFRGDFVWGGLCLGVSFWQGISVTQTYTPSPCEQNDRRFIHFVKKLPWYKTSFAGDNKSQTGQTLSIQNTKIGYICLNKACFRFTIVKSFGQILNCIEFWLTQVLIKMSLRSKDLS